MKGLFSVALFLLLNISCGSSEERDYKKAVSKVEKQEYSDAIILFEQSILRNPTSKFALLSAKEGAKISYYNTQDFNKAVEFLRYTILNSNSSDDRISAQKLLVKVLFENLNDYQKSILEINRLISMSKEESEIEKLRLNLARCYYYLNNFEQAQSEAVELILKGKDPEIAFQMMVLKGNIHLAKKEISQAATVFNDILKKYPDKSVKENIASTLAVAYEEMKDYKAAIEVLQSMKQYHSMPEYIELRIKRLMQSQKNLPGARGGRRK